METKKDIPVYRIFIKGDSIRRNPAYKEHLPGVRQYLPTNPVYSILYKDEIPEELSSYFSEPTVLTEKYTLFGKEQTNVSYFQDVKSIKYVVKKLKEEGISFQIKTEPQLVDVTSCISPNPYLYEYERIALQCEECDAIFSSDFLQTDDCFNNGFTNDRVCPYCGVWDCCNVEWETLEEALQRLNLKEEDIQ